MNSMAMKRRSPSSPYSWMPQTFAVPHLARELDLRAEAARHVRRRARPPARRTLSATVLVERRGRGRGRPCPCRPAEWLQDLVARRRPPTRDGRTSPAGAAARSGSSPRSRPGSAPRSADRSCRTASIPTATGIAGQEGEGQAHEIRGPLLLRHVAAAVQHDRPRARGSRPRSARRATTGSSGRRGPRPRASARGSRATCAGRPSAVAAGQQRPQGRARRPAAPAAPAYSSTRSGVTRRSSWKTWRRPERRPSGRAAAARSKTARRHRRASSAQEPRTVARARG